MKQIEINKQMLRKQYISIRNRIERKREKSEIIIYKVIKNVEYKNSKIVALYKSLRSEVNTDELIKYSINNGKIVVLPKVINNELMFYKINSIKDKLIKSKFGIEEPIGNKENFIDKDNIDLVIVPGLIFDKEKNRIGFGKGFYDKYLSKTNLKAIGICFEEQIVDKLPISTTDVKMQKIITDKAIY